MGYLESASSGGTKNPGSLCQSIMGYVAGPVPPVVIMVCIDGMWGSGVYGESGS